MRVQVARRLRRLLLPRVARAAETLGRRRCLALRSAVTRRSARWLARFGAAAARKMRDALEAETWAVPEGGETTKKVVASASFLSRAAEAYLLVARRAPALARTSRGA